MKAGDKIVTIGDCNRFFSDRFFSDGDKAVLSSQDQDGDWWADFTGNEEYYMDGIWCVGPVDVGFKLDITGE